MVDKAKKHVITVEFTTSKLITHADAEIGLQKLFDDRLDLDAKPMFICSVADELNNVYGEGVKIRKRVSKTKKTKTTVSKR